MNPHQQQSPEQTWRKASYSSQNVDCVEVAVAPETVGVRDTKRREAGQLSAGREQWASLLADVRARYSD